MKAKTTLPLPLLRYQKISSGVTAHIEVARASAARRAGPVGPRGEARRITETGLSFQRYYGFPYLAWFTLAGVFRFFNNGGRQCYVVRALAHNAVAHFTSRSRTAPAVALAESLFTQIQGSGAIPVPQIGSIDPDNEFKLSVGGRVEVTPPPLKFSTT